MIKRKKAYSGFKGQTKEGDEVTQSYPFKEEDDDDDELAIAFSIIIFINFKREDNNFWLIFIF